jgi:hypothetical protein
LVADNARNEQYKILLCLGLFHNNSQLSNLQTGALEKNIFCCNVMFIEELQARARRKPVAMQMKIGKWKWIGHN